MNGDDVYNLYISSSATDLTNATLVQSGNNWIQTNSATTSPGLFTESTEYLIVEVFNVGGPGGFLGDFSLSNTSYQFDNGTQSLLTGDSAWSVSTSGISGTYTSTTSEGLNGVNPWGYMALVNSNAAWITDNSYGDPLNNGGNGTLYFKTSITAANVANVANVANAVPEPAFLALLIAGFLGFGVSRKKSRHKIYQTRSGTRQSVA